MRRWTRPSMMGQTYDMHRGRSVIISAAAVVLAVGAGAIYWTTFASTGTNDVPEGRVVAAASCLAPNVVSSTMPGAVTTAVDLQDAPEAGRLPIDFDVVGLVVCEFAGDGAANNQLLRETERAGAFLADALVALSAASDPSRGPDSCPTVGTAPTPTVWAVDELGNAVRLAIPRDACGQLKGDPMAVVEQVPVKSEREYELPSAS